MKTNPLPLTPDGRLIDEIDFRGNIVCHAWFSHIKTDAGKADTIGCVILSEIIYWYRGADVVENGKMIGRKRKFDADLLQKSYGDFVEQFGFTKKQVKDAFDRLQKAGLIERVWRTIKVRGMNLPNVLFIRVVPDKIRAISFFPTDQLFSGENAAQGGSPQKSGDVPSTMLPHHFKFEPTTDEIPGDKYREYNRDYLRDISLDLSTTTSSMEPGKPASTEGSNFFTEKTGPRSLAREAAAVSSGPSKNVGPAILPATNANPVLDEDFAEINRVLCQAFGGNTFTRHGEAKLKEYIKTGRITRLWAEGFARVKRAFDQDRDKFKAGKRFIPVQPKYLFDNFDLTENAMLDALDEWHSIMEEMTRGFEVDDHAQAATVIADYDAYFRRNKCLEPGYEAWVKSYQGRRDTVFDVLCDPKQFPSWHPDDVVPPAWMRLLYANKINIYSFEAIRKALLTAAQAELRKDPRCLRFVGVDLSHEQISEVFDLDYEAELTTWQKEFDQRDEQLAAVEDILAEIENCQATGLLK